MSRQPSRIPALDALRGIAILLVILHHCGLFGDLRPRAAADGIVSRIAASGWIGVDLFFVLSGFLITGILCDAKGKAHYFRNFYARRCLRIFPLYYLALTLFFLALPLIFQTREPSYLRPEDQAWYWTYLINVKIAISGWPHPFVLAHFWSLAVEEQFYLLWPAVVFLLPRRGLFAATGACMVLALAVRFALAWGKFGLAAYVLTIARIDSLATGSMLALLARQPGGLMCHRRVAWAVVACTGVVLAAVAIRRGGLWTDQRLIYTVGFTLLSWFFGAILTLATTATRESPIARLLASPTLTLFGRYSYGLYVFHHPVLLFTSTQLFRVSDVPAILGSQLPAFAIYTTVAGGLSFAVAMASWHLFENRFLLLKERFTS